MAKLPYCLLALIPHLSPVLASPHTTTPLSENENILVSSFSNTSLSHWLYYYTTGAHLAGKNISQAEWTRDKWTENGIPSEIIAYDVLLNYPVEQKLQLRYPDGGSGGESGKVYTPTLKEDALEEDFTTMYPESEKIPTFHGYSFSGVAEAEFVYVGYGRHTDFERLHSLGVPLAGKIALAKYGGLFRGLKIKNAQEFGMVGVILFTDPGDDGNVTEANGFAAYPKGPARNPSAVQRGSVQFLSLYPGDPTTPNYPSKPGVPRVSNPKVLAQIPSLPLSYREAIPLLAALNGHGKTADEVAITGWKGGLNVSYSTGPAEGAVLSMTNFMKDVITPIWDTVGIINGTGEADEVVVIGNHRDAWVVGGAGDPNSGSAVLVELSKAFGALLKKGWKPKRTIILASWDAEEYGLVGSTEWFEEYMQWAIPNMVAYLNVDVAVSGPQLYIGGVPELHDLVKETMKKVLSPVGEGKSLLDVWEEGKRKVEVLGSGSDYTAFLQNGIPSLDLGFNNGPNDPIYHYHSDYDSYHWMSTYGDPGFHYHRALGQYLGLLGLTLADQDLLPLNASTYSEALHEYFETLQESIKNAPGDGKAVKVEELEQAIEVFKGAAREAMGFAGRAKGEVEMKKVNGRLMGFERAFVGVGGLPGREFYKHVIYSPGLDTGYAPVTFPGITEAVQAGNATLAQEWVTKTTKAILAAAVVLRGA